MKWNSTYSSYITIFAFEKKYSKNKPKIINLIYKSNSITK